jgi:hypothetical protein
MPAHAKKTKTQKTGDKSTKVSPDPDLHCQIEKRAYEIWLSSGIGHGADVDHWLQAETEVLAHRQNNTRLGL